MNFKNKIELQVLLKTKTRLNLCLGFETRYKHEYLSLSVFTEAILIKRLDTLEEEELNE